MNTTFSRYLPPILALSLQACGGLNNDPNINGQTPFKLILTSTAPETAVAGECSSTDVILRLVQSDDGNTVYADQDIVISVKAWNAQTELEDQAFLHTGDSCNGTDSAVTLTTGSAETSFKLQLTDTDTTRITFLADSTDITSLDLNLTVTPNLPGTLVLSDLPAAITVNTAFSGSLQILDFWYNPVGDASATIQVLAYTDASCSTLAEGTLQGASTAALNGTATLTGLRYSAIETIYLEAEVPSTQIRSNCAGPIAVQ
jgi:hypothetical protein